MYKKAISCLLALTMFVYNSSFVFAAETELEYKPAKSFEYDYFTTGRTNEDEFVAKLKQDMYDNYIDIPQEPERFQAELTNNEEGVLHKHSNVKKAYNDLLYYNYLPEESPYWKWTAFVPDNEATEEDVLLILQKHKEISEEISKLFKKDPKYQRERQDKITLWVAGGFALALMSFYLWELIPVAGGTAGGGAAAAKTVTTAGAVGAKLWGFSKAFFVLAVDILSTDQVAYTVRNLKGIKEYMDHIDIYVATTIENIEDRNMLKSQIESNEIQICDEAEQKYQEYMLKIYTYDNNKEEDFQELDNWKVVRKFCKGNNKIFKDKNARLKIGKYLLSAYQKFDLPQEYIEYARTEMLRIYYALLFIKEELLDKSDRLRFDRATIDIITAYKVANITITDGRLIKLFADSENKTQLDILKDKGITDDHLNEKVDNGRNTLGGKLASSYSTAYSYPSLLPRSQLNFLVQQIDMHYNIPYEEDLRIKDEEWQRSWNEYMRNNPYGIPK